MLVFGRFIPTLLKAIMALLPRVRRAEQQVLLQTNLQRFALKMPPYQIIRFDNLNGAIFIHQEFYPKFQKWILLSKRLP
jgi:hypothetical protein